MCPLLDRFSDHLFRFSSMPHLIKVTMVITDMERKKEKKEERKIPASSEVRTYDRCQHLELDPTVQTVMLSFNISVLHL